MTEPVVAKVLTQYRTWAVVGCSPEPWRDSHRIAALLQSRGYRVVPVNPRCDEVLGERSYPTLEAAAADHDIQVVDVFRRSELAGAHVDEAVAIGARAVWLQLDVHAPEAAARARAAGLDVVEQRCPAIELPHLRQTGDVSL
jgi:predicted CoA-binding protein